jgi:ribosome-associated translation inhibitor RaiA
VIYPRDESHSEANTNQFKRALNRMRISSVDSHIRAKYEKTIEFFETIYKEFGEYHGQVNLENLKQAHEICATIEYDSRMRPKILDAAMRGNNFNSIIKAAGEKAKKLKASSSSTHRKLVKKGL